MARLIDADALQLEPDPWGGMNGVICLGRSGGKTMATVQAALKRMIDNAPTIDAVEVIRCDNCLYSEPCKPYNKVWCEKMGRYMKQDGFCSEGVKKDAEER